MRSPNSRVRQGINAGCDTGYAAPSLAIAAWEALIHELLLSDFPRLVHLKNPLWKIPLAHITRWGIRDKTLIVPDFLFGRTFDKGAQPYQDFDTLVTVRNEFVHFKNSIDTPLKNATKYLEGKRLLLTAKRPAEIPADADYDYPWPGKFACTEMIRWSINTVAAMARRLEEIVDDKESLPLSLCTNFQPVGEAWVRGWYAEHQIKVDDA